MKNSFWVWNFLTWLWLSSLISRLTRDIYLNWVAAEVLKVGAGNFRVIFATQLIACPLRAESLCTISQLPNTITANSCPLECLAYMSRSLGFIFMSCNCDNCTSSPGWRPHHIHISTLCFEILLFKHPCPIAWCLGFWLYKLLATIFPP